MENKKYMSLGILTEYDTLIKSEIKERDESILASSKKYTDDEIGKLDIPSTLSDLTTDSTHRVVTDSQISAWNAKSNFSGSYTDLTNKPTLGSLAAKSTVAKSDLASAVQTSLGKADTALQSFTETDPTVPAWAKASTKPTYTYSEVGADKSGSANTALTNAKAYTDEKIEELVGGEFAVSNAEHATTADTATNATNATHATSADSATSATKATQDASGNTITTTYETKDDASSKLSTAKSYADGLIAALDVTDAAVSGKYVSAVNETNGKISVTRASLPDYSETYAPISHTHAISDVSNLQSTLNGKVPTSRTVNGKALSANITLSASDVGADASGAASAVQTNLDTHTGNTDIHFTSDERTKLSGIQAGAQKNTVTGVKGGSESSYRTGNINITKANIGLGNVDNTSDANKPVSTAQQTAINTALSSAKSYTDEKIDALVGEGASETLDTIGEISAAIEENQGMLETLNSAIGNKANASDLTSHTGNTSNPHGVTKAQVGLGNVENKSSATIRGELTKANVTTALGYTPPTSNTNTTYDLAASASSTNGNVKLNLTAGGSGSGTDSVTIKGSGATSVTTDANGVITITSTDNNTVYTHPTSGVTAGTYKSVTVDANGHVTGGSNPTTLSGYGITDAAAKSHTHSDYVNQNAFSKIVVGTITVEADTATDTLTLVAGSNVTLTPDATNDKITIAAKDTVYTHPTSHPASMITGLATVATSGSYNDLSNKPTIPAAYTHPTSSGNKHIPSGGSSGQILRWSADGTAVWGDDNNTTYTLGSFGVTATATELNYVDGVTSNIQTQLDGKAASSHTHSAYVNQNAFSNVTVGSTTIAADSTTDTLTLVAGSNITLTPDATNDKITIAATDTKYTHPSYTAKSSGLYKITVDASGHVSATTAVAKSDITALGIPSTNTTYSVATSSADGLMSKTDKANHDTLYASAYTNLTTDDANTLVGEVFG